jgi:hypothetical protein
MKAVSCSISDSSTNSSGGSWDSSSRARKGLLMSWQRATKVSVVVAGELVAVVAGSEEFWKQHSYICSLYK